MYEENQAPATLIEIYHQAGSCRRTVERAGERSRVFEQFLPLENYTDIIITGCGSSHHLAKCASFAWSEILERPVVSAASSELAHFPEHYLARDAKPLVIAISRTGGTTEAKLAVVRLQQQFGARCLAVTTEGGSIGGTCEAELVFDECLEGSVVMTQAFTCMLVGLYMLADGASGWRHARETRWLPDIINEFLRVTEQMTRLLGEDQTIKRFFFLGSGPMKGLADECALKMTEMALTTSFSYRTLEFRHGPKAMLNSTDQIIIFPVDAELPHLDMLLAEIAATDARVLVVVEQACVFANPVVARLSNTQSETAASQLEVFRPALYAHIGQLVALWRARACDLNPDAPPHLARTVVLEG